MPTPDPLKRREPRNWPDYEQPVLLPVTGFRDQIRRITYLPWSDVLLGIVGWELIPDRIKIGQTVPILVYIVPTTGEIGLEIRCHLAHNEPDPSSDQLLGKVIIPNDLLYPDS